MTYRPMKSVEKIIIHCAATTADMDIGASEIDKWHRDRGFFMIGYHYVIRRDGSIEVGRPLDRPGAHARGHNHNSIGICLVGGLDSEGNPADNFTENQFETLKKLLGDLRLSFPKADILGHRDIPNVKKACPSFDVKEWLTSIEEKDDDYHTHKLGRPEDPSFGCS